MRTIHPELRAAVEAVQADLHARAELFHPDEDAVAGAAINAAIATRVTDVRQRLAEAGRTDKRLDAFAIDNAYPHDMRELAGLLGEMLEREPNVVTKPRARFAFFPGFPLFSLFFVFALIIGAAGIRPLFNFAVDVLRGEAGAASRDRWSAGLIPPKPSRYVTDEADVLSSATIRDVNEALAKFERDTSNQVLVFVSRSVPDGTSLEEFATKAFTAWGVGQKARDNGVVLFLFTRDRRMRIEVGYGLEGVLTDALSRRILDTVVRPELRAGRYDDAVTTGANAIMAAARGEGLTGSGRTVAETLSFATVAQYGFGGVVVLLVYALAACLLALIPQLFLGRPGTWKEARARRRDRPHASDTSSGSSGSSDSSFTGGGGSSGGGGASSSW